jgi:hypothetical protein
MKITIEGSLVELQGLPQLQGLLQASTAVPAAAPAHNDQAETQAHPVTAQLLCGAVLRKQLSARQRALLRVLYQQSDWISAAELARQSGVSETAFAGTFGGVGLRLSHTPNWPANLMARPIRFVIDTERRNGIHYYRLSTVFRQALDMAGVLRD